MTISIPVFLTAMGIPTAVTGFFFWLLKVRIQRWNDDQKREREQRQREVDEREHQRKEYEKCQLKMITATMALAEATATAVERIPDAHCNGDMHKALAYAVAVKNEQKDFLMSQTIDSLDL